MIDNVCILLSTLLCVYVVIRAIKLDRVVPWFGTGQVPATGDVKLDAAARRLLQRHNQRYKNHETP